MRFVAFVVILTLLPGTFALAADNAPKSYSDAASTFTLEAPADWTRQTESEKILPAMALSLSKIEIGNVSHLYAINVTEIAHKEDNHPDLSALAAGLIKSAKEDHPDQEGYGKVEKTKLDGVDALAFTYLSQATGSDVNCMKSVLAFRNGKIYIIQFLCAKADYAKNVGVADKILATFHWK
ncbi:MAG TPA: PsbP-related protein [Tepidisphaeraceae bacterium]|jgi:hypothetical protein|nr:PsbP-related protein [Tepidisphaeraceae bacterium]